MHGQQNIKIPQLHFEVSHDNLFARYIQFTVRYELNVILGTVQYVTYRCVVMQLRFSAAAEWSAKIPTNRVIVFTLME